MPLPLRRSLLLALCFALPAHAAPRRPAAKKATARKAPTPSSAEARAMRELRRMVVAYDKLNSYTVTSRDTVKFGPVNLSGQGVASVAKDGRRSVRSEFLMNNGGAPAIESVKLYDGKQFHESTRNRFRNMVSNKTYGAAQLKRNPDVLSDFFAPSPGLLAVTSLKQQNFGFGTKSGVAFSFRNLEGGKSEVRVRYTEKSKHLNGADADVSILLVVGADGFLQRIEGKEGRHGTGRVEFYANSFLSSPQPVDPQLAFNWDNLLSPPPQIIGQQGDIPPVAPESGTMPPQ